jgi:hypothetical protein
VEQVTSTITFCCFLSEKKTSFVIATANNIDLLPLEIIRKEDLMYFS